MQSLIAIPHSCPCQSSIPDIHISQEKVSINLSGFSNDATNAYKTIVLQWPCPCWQWEQDKGMDGIKRLSRLYPSAASRWKSILLRWISRGCNGLVSTMYHHYEKLDLLIGCFFIIVRSAIWPPIWPCLCSIFLHLAHGIRCNYKEIICPCYL